MARVRTGLEVFTSSPPAELSRAVLGLLANQASVGPGFIHAADMIDQALPGRLKRLFGPQHGFAGEKQDNMVESGHGVETGTGRPIYSLYGETRRPSRDMLDGLDILLIDLLDVGTRVYTFAQTMAYCLMEAGRMGIKVLVLDRPNPIGGLEVEGNLLKPDCASFVGLFPVPMRHGLTIGELALYIADQISPHPEVQVIPMFGWKRAFYYPDTGIPWVYPSPNMPHPETAWVYPGQVLWEGTNISEGRGTTRPFHLFGAPFLDPYLLREELLGIGIKGAVFRPAVFEPTFHKYAGQICHGLEIHPQSPDEFNPYLTSLTLLELIIKHYPNHFSWRRPPYEYEYERWPIDLILGDSTIRPGLSQGLSAAALAETWQPDLDSFFKARKKYLLY